MHYRTCNPNFLDRGHFSLVCSTLEYESKLSDFIVLEDEAISISAINISDQPMNLNLFHSNAWQILSSRFHKLSLLLCLSARIHGPRPLQLQISPNVLILTVYLVQTLLVIHMLLRLCYIH